MDDHELLQTYAEHGSEEAFTALVRRHLDLVYSAARRQVRSREMAEEVAQSVFIDLARAAKKITPTQPLVAWLFLVTRRTAIDAVRKESRRRALETNAFENGGSENVPAPAADKIEPLLDEAIAALNEADRRVIILRFFESRSLREIGASLGASEDAAQKRVSRALEQLRRVFGKRGVVMSTATVATQLSAIAINTAPASLVANVSGLAALAGASAQVSGILFMTTVKKIALSAALALSVSVAVYEARELSNQREKVRALERRLEMLLEESAALRTQRAALSEQLTRVTDDLSTARTLALSGDPKIESALEAWLDRVQSLRTWLDKMPDKRILELSYLNEDDWLEAAKNAKVDTEFGVRQALARLRMLALQRFGTHISGALSRYKKETGRQLPLEPVELLEYFDPPIDPKILQNYEIAEREGTKFIDAEGKIPKLVLRNKLVDDIYDAQISHMGSGTLGAFVNLSDMAIAEAVREYRQKNNGQSPADPAQIAPYLRRAIHPEYLKLALKDAAKIR